MRATYECEQCFEEYDHEDEFVRCHGDACHEEVCRKCAEKCKDPTCNNYVCKECKSGSSRQYCGDYCIDCAMWEDEKDEEGEETGDWVNFDYVAKGLTHDQGLKFLKTGTLPK